MKKQDIKNDKSFSLPIWYKPVLVLFVIVAIWGFAWLTGLDRYSLAVAKCGTLQPIVLTKFFTKEYVLPGDVDYHPPYGIGMLGFSGYACTVSEAKSRGYGPGY